MRLDTLRYKIVEHELDGMLITDPLNRRYLSGFTGSAGMLLVTTERAVLVVDFRYVERAVREAPDWEHAHVAATYPQAVAESVAGAGLRRLGVEADHVTVAQLREMEQLMPGVDLIPLSDVVAPMRAIKDEGEIAAIRAAVRCADAAFAHLCGVIRPGMTEIDVAWELESHMRLHGASAVAFPLIVAAGPNGAMPHATCSERPVQAGEPIVMDYGALVDGYRSDATRTLCLGSADDRYLEVWRQVLEAQQAVVEQLRPGMSGKEADAIARDRFTRAGNGERFGHGLGHGVGLAIHETPFMNARSDEVILQPGMVITVEPGLYYPGWGGVRIEDTVVVREEGVEVLTGAPKEPVLAV